MKPVAKYGSSNSLTVGKKGRLPGAVKAGQICTLQRTEAERATFQKRKFEHEALSGAADERAAEEEQAHLLELLDAAIARRNAARARTAAASDQLARDHPDVRLPPRATVELRPGGDAPTPAPREAAATQPTPPTLPSSKANTFMAPRKEIEDVKRETQLKRLRLIEQIASPTGSLEGI